jgi:hypothetical protein
MYNMYRDRKDTAIAFALIGFLTGLLFGLAYTAAESPPECAAVTVQPERHNDA